AGGDAAAATLGPAAVSGGPASDGNGFGMYINAEPFIFLTSTLPAKPAVWTLRTYFGLVSKASGSYTYSPVPSNAAVPGLQIVAKATTPAVFDPSKPADLSKVHTVPDPYYVSNAMEITANQKVLKFVNLPPQEIIRIYSVSGVMVIVLVHDYVVFSGG